MNECCGINEFDELNECKEISLCNGDRTDNMFWRLGAPGYPGKCILDEMNFGQLQRILSRNPLAQEHLARITDSPIIRKFASETPMTMSEADDSQQFSDRINKKDGRGADTLPFYTVFKGTFYGSL